MADKIYFGIPGNIQVLPYPESGMGYDNTVDSEVTNLLSGGRSVFRPPTAFKQFNMSWRGSTAGLAGLIDMYNGEFGQGPFFLNDPTMSQNNVLPARWANSWQLAHLSNGWCRPVVNNITPTVGSPVATTPNTNKSVTFTQVTTPSATSGVLKMRSIRVPGKAYWLAVKGSATNGTSRTNLVTNPSSGVNSTGYAAVAGTGGTAAVTQVATGGSTTPTFSRVTWSVATTAASGGVSYTVPSPTFGAGLNYAISAWVRSSITQTVTFGIDWKQGGGSYVSTSQTTGIALTANTWTQVFVTAPCPTVANQGVINVTATGSVWSAGSTLDIQGVLVETGTTQGVFFDGSFPSTSTLVHAWTGTANASTSTETPIPGIKIRGFRSDTNVWEDSSTFNTWTGVSTSILTTANTTYEMLELDFYMPAGATLTLSGMALSTVNLATVTPVDWMPRGQGTGALQFTSASQGNLVSIVVDRIGMSVTMTEVQNVESLML